MHIWLNFGWHLGRTYDAMVSMERSPLVRVTENMLILFDFINYVFSFSRYTSRFALAYQIETVVLTDMFYIHVG